MTFEFPHSVSLAQLPTPIVALERLSKHLEGPKIYLKRDDYTGLALTGNKVRKLEFLLADALDKKCDHVITCGGSQSNHARSTAVACTKLGLKCHLVLRNNMGAALEGNLFLDRLVGAEIQYITPEEYMRVDEIMRVIARDLKQSGNRPYVIPEGGSNELGSLGYLKAAQEIARQMGELKTEFNHIVVAVGSGGTYAGMLLGKYLFDIPSEIHGINICDNESYFIKKISDIIKKMQKRFEIDVTVTKNDIKIIDGYVGKGYGLSSQEELDMIKRVACSEGVILDPVYTGKAMVGIADQIRLGNFRSGESVLFIHTGGIFGIFSKRGLFF